MTYFHDIYPEQAGGGGEGRIHRQAGSVVLKR